MTLFFIVVVLLFFMNSPLLIESQNCSLDIDCLEMGEGFCIYGKCYARKEYGELCSYDKQCHEDQRCLKEKCSCPKDYYWLRTRCTNRECDFDSDCKEGDYCSIASFGSWCYFDNRSSGVPGFIAIPITGVVVFILVLCILECRPRCGDQSITQPLIRDRQPTTVIQRVTVQ